MSKVTVLDYGVGNLRSIAKAFEALGASVIVSSARDKIVAADRLVLPGVGSFQSGSDFLVTNNIREVIYGLVSRERPILGICLGMQLFFDTSEESPNSLGLGIIPGQVAKLTFPAGLGSYIGSKVPHVGWKQLYCSETIEKQRELCLGQQFGSDEYYFTHSYVVRPSCTNIAAAYFKHGLTREVGAVARNNLVGCQFHPEKSAAAGLSFLSAFLNR